MRYTNVLSLMLVLGLVLSAETRSQTDEAMMEKGRAGIPLGSPFDRSMCAMEGVSTGGFDLVSYRQPDGPTPGIPELSMEFNGSRYLFANQSNLDAFRADPEH